MNANKIVSKRLKPNKDFFDWCTNNFPKYEFARKKEIIKSYTEDKNSVKRETLTKQLRKNTNFKKFYKEKLFVIVLATKKRIEIQTYLVWQQINEYTLEEIINIKLWNMEIFENDEHHKIGFSQYNLSYTPGLTKTSEMCGAYTYAKFYPQNYNDVFKKSVLRHFDMNRHFDIYTIDRLYKYRLGLEHLQRKNNSHLFSDIVYGHADMRKVTKKFVRNNDKLIRLNFDFIKIIIFNLINDHNSGAKPNIKAIKYLDNCDKNVILKHLNRPQFNRLQNYLVKQKRSLRYYDDYINMLHEIGNHSDEDMVLFPKNLEAEHDKLVGIINALKQEEELKLEKREKVLMQEISSRLKKYEYKNNEYQVVAPNELKDIVDEGIELSHCVGSKHYLDKHKKGEETIMFVRKASDKSTPFYTMTFVDSKNKVTQIHGKGNEVTDEDPLIEDFIKNEWLPYVSKVKGATQ